MADDRYTYGDDPSQYAELTRPEGASRGVVVVIHGGFWKAAYDASLGRPLAADLAARGWTAWNIEYRRVGPGAGGGGGVPGHARRRRGGHRPARRGAGPRPDDRRHPRPLGRRAPGDLGGRAGPLRLAGDGAGDRGDLAGRGARPRRARSRRGSAPGRWRRSSARPPGPAYDRVDPTRQLPLDVPVWCVHPDDDAVVPLSQSADYVDRAVAAGATAELVEVEGDHFVVIDPQSAALGAHPRDPGRAGLMPVRLRPADPAAVAAALAGDRGSRRTSGCSPSTSSRCSPSGRPAARSRCGSRRTPPRRSSRGSGTPAAPRPPSSSWTPTPGSPSPPAPSPGPTPSPPAGVRASGERADLSPYLPLG